MLNAQRSTVKHVVAKNENVFRLSLRYGVSMNSIYRLNPRAERLIRTGDTLIIPKRKNYRAPHPNDIEYTVTKYDTKFGISKKHNISIAELERANPHIVRMLKKGHIIIIPFTDSDSHTIESHTIEEKSPVDEEDNVKINTEDTNTDIKANNSSNESDKPDTNSNVNSNTSNEKTHKTLNVNVFWKNLNDLNEGELKKQKTNYENGLSDALNYIKIEHPKNPINDIKDSVSNTNQNSTETNEHSISLFPTDSLNHRINSLKGIDRLSIEYKYKDTISKFFLRGLPTKKSMRNKVLEYIKSYDANYICVYDKKNSQNKNIIDSTLTGIQFIKAKKNGSFDSDALRKLLQKEKKNFVIIESNNVGTFLSATNTLLREISSTDIQLVVLDPKNIPSGSVVTTTRFKILRLLYPQQYNTKLNNGMDKVSALAFAINYDALQRVYEKGLNAFDHNHKTSVLGFSFNYELNNGVYENKAVPLFIFDESSNATPISEH